MQEEEEKNQGRWTYWDISSPYSWKSKIIFQNCRSSYLTFLSFIFYQEITFSSFVFDNHLSNNFIMTTPRQELAPNIPLKHPPTKGGTSLLLPLQRQPHKFAWKIQSGRPLPSRLSHLISTTMWRLRSSIGRVTCLTSSA